MCDLPLKEGAELELELREEALMSLQYILLGEESTTAVAEKLGVVGLLLLAKAGISWQQARLGWLARSILYQLSYSNIDT
jgi:hypothetical protein